MSRIIICLSLLFYCGVSSLSDSEVRESLAKAEVQSCSGCSLRSLPEVKSFIFEDVPQYEKVIYKNIQGAVPELVLFSENYEELKRIPLRDLSRKECNELLQEWGFTRKEKSEL